MTTEASIEQGITFERPFTDLGNAERLVAAHGRDLRYSPGLGWFAWDGHRWKPDRDGEVMRRAKNTIRAMYARAAALDDADERKRMLGFAIKSESEARLRAAVKLAETELEVIVGADELDADPWLFNAGNGTIDLQTGELREHSRGDLLVKTSAVEYDPAARSELWQRFLERITGGDPELERFLARAVGYSLTGHTSEEVLFFCHGPSATGKSTTLEALRAVFGEYGAVADFETFLKRHGDAGVRNDVARLAGARLVISVEVDDGKSLAEGLLKLLTGGDTVAARFLYSETFEFRPRFKLWLAANDRPRVNADDSAMWRRIIQPPFTVVIPEAERDERLKIQLRTPEVQTAILTWAVNGCLEWQQQGLNVPDSVRDYTASYRAEMDPLRDWLDDCTTADPAARTSNQELRESYETWCQANGEKPLTAKRFGQLLELKGFISVRSGRARGRDGIRLGEQVTRVTHGARDSEKSLRDETLGSFTETHDTPVTRVTPETQPPADDVTPDTKTAYEPLTLPDTAHGPTHARPAYVFGSDEEAEEEAA